MAKPATRGKRIDTLYCSFCGKSQHEVHKLIAGPTVFICDECTDLCATIVLENVNASNALEYLPNTFESLKGSELLETILARLGSEPLYSIKDLSAKPKTCFYLGPFVEPFNAIYSDHLRPVVEEAGFSISRADEIFGSRAIMHDIWEGLFCSEVILADVTGKNPNVMYEIGLAHAMGKPVVMLTQSIDDVPFDLRHYRCLVYSHTPRGCEELMTKLSGTLSALGKAVYRLSLTGR